MTHSTVYVPLCHIRTMMTNNLLIHLMLLHSSPLRWRWFSGNSSTAVMTFLHIWRISTQWKSSIYSDVQLSQCVMQMHSSCRNHHVKIVRINLLYKIWSVVHCRRFTASYSCKWIVFCACDRSHCVRIPTLRITYIVHVLRYASHTINSRHLYKYDLCLYLCVGYRNKIYSRIMCTNSGTWAWWTMAVATAHRSSSADECDEWMNGLAGRLTGWCSRWFQSTASQRIVAH